jgi:hypothetical protein
MARSGATVGKEKSQLDLYFEFMTEGIVEILKGLVKSRYIFLDGYVCVDLECHEDEDKTKDVVALVTLKMFLHIFVDLDSILLVKSLSKNGLGGRMELGVEVVKSALEFVLEFKHIVGWHHVSAPSVIDFIVETVAMRINCSWYRWFTQSHA